MAYASADDVQKRLGRPLTEDESQQVNTLLDDVEILIKARIPDLDTKVDAETIGEDVVRLVEANSVVRLLRNPNGYTGETDGTYSYQVNWRLSTGELEITNKEWSLLGVSSGMFMINMVPGTLPNQHVPFSHGG